MSILVLNAGSSSLKFSVFDDAARDKLAGGMVERNARGENDTLTLRLSHSEGQHFDKERVDASDDVLWILRGLASVGLNDPIRAVGHRVVHGGTEFRRSTQIDDKFCESLKSICELAPLHNPPALAVIEAARKALPEAPHFAVFDTSFFADLPPARFLYPVPYEWYEQFGIRRFGFHGISHAYCAARAAELLDRQGDPSTRVIICHLGNGCSATGIRGGVPIATTMGFTPLEGLMMGTRSGSIDPGLLLHLLQSERQTPDELAHTLNHRSGLLGVSDVSSDFRDVQQAADSGDKRAQFAIEMFADRVRSTIGSLAVTLGGVDALVFTAGIGEHSNRLRTHVMQGLECLGIQLDEDRNRSSKADCDIASKDSTGRVFIIHTEEERMIACEGLKFIL